MISEKGDQKNKTGGENWKIPHPQPNVLLR